MVLDAGMTIRGQRPTTGSVHRAEMDNQPERHVAAHQRPDALALYPK